MFYKRLPSSKARIIACSRKHRLERKECGRGEGRYRANLMMKEPLSFNKALSSRRNSPNKLTINLSKYGLLVRKESITKLVFKVCFFFVFSFTIKTD